MHRYSAAYLEQHPEKRGQDIVTTRRSCRRYLRIPVSMLNFMEGTRFTREKHEEQSSPYRHLLRPRVGGIAHTLAVMGDQLNDVLDVTIAYDHPEPSLWNWVCGRIREIRVVVREIDVSAEFRNASIVEPGPERDRFKLWINELWAQKDDILAAAKGQMLSAVRKVS
jgi:1-acyl-sn-glycerol-3-phosphate acyltransferase